LFYLQNTSGSPGQTDQKGCRQPDHTKVLATQSENDTFPG
jgi:hypothetical protein